MGQITELLGWLTAISFFIAVANFFLKYINKSYISKLTDDKKKLKDLYKKIMRVVVRNHRLFGFIAVISVIIHFIIAYTYIKLSITGLIAAILMLSIVSLGMYGVYINKNMKGNWLRVHRVLGFLMIVVFISHIIYQ